MYQVNMVFPILTCHSCCQPSCTMCMKECAKLSRTENLGGLEK